MPAMITVAASAAAAGLVACGGSSEADAGDERASFEDAQLEFAQCMRENGVDMPDPEPGEGGFRFRIEGGVDPESESFKAAEEECQPILDEAIPEGERPDPAEMRDRAHEMTECLRDKGYDVPEPQIATPGDGPTTSKSDSGPGQAPDEQSEGPDELEDLMDDPEFQQAQEDCSQQAGLPAPSLSRREPAPDDSGGSGGGGDSGLEGVIE